MDGFLILCIGAIVTFVYSLDFSADPGLFDDLSSSPVTWSLDDATILPQDGALGAQLSLPESDLSGDGSMPSMFMSSEVGDIGLDATLFTDDGSSIGQQGLDGLNQVTTEDYGTLSTDVALGDTNLNLVADCGSPFLQSGKRRIKRGESCKMPSTTATEPQPDGIGPSPPSPGNEPSFFPGYREYVLDPETNVLRIPGFSARYNGENDVCLIYTEGYLPYGVCGTELFKSVAQFWGIETYTIPKAVLGMSSALESA